MRSSPAIQFTSEENPTEPQRLKANGPVGSHNTLRRGRGGEEEGEGERKREIIGRKEESKKGKTLSPQIRKAV